MFASSNYSQYTLIKKFNQYFFASQQPLIPEAGYCQGLAVLWLKRMTVAREEEFYQQIHEIIDCTRKKIQDISYLIAKMYKSTDRKQNPEKYTRNHVTQVDVHKTLKATRQEIVDDKFTCKDLFNFFLINNAHDNMFLISHSRVLLNTNMQHIKHAVAVYIRNQEYYLYDPNFIGGREKKFYDPHLLVQTIAAQMFTDFSLQVPNLMSLCIHKLHANDLLCRQNNKKRSLYGKITNTLVSSFNNLLSLHPSFSYFSAETAEDDTDNTQTKKFRFK